MAVTVEVQSINSETKDRRSIAATQVLRRFGALPRYRLLVFLDDSDWADVKQDIGPDNRGLYIALKRNTFRGGWRWPDHVSKLIFGRSNWHPGDQRLFDHVIYLHGTTCEDETALTMTLSHELQHFAQYGFSRKQWAGGRLIACLSRETLNRTGMNWCDIPHEREARVVAKRIAMDICGKEAVDEYSGRRIGLSRSESDRKDWLFIRELDPLEPFNLEKGTVDVFNRLRPFRHELQQVLWSFKDDPDFKDILISDYFDDG